MPFKTLRFAGNRGWTNTNFDVTANDPLAILRFGLFYGSSSTRSKSLSVSAKEVTVPTGIQLSSGDEIRIRASGTWSDKVNANRWTGPDGFAEVDGGAKRVDSFLSSALLAKVGTGSWFLVGSYLDDYMVSSSGELKFGINDRIDWLGDNGGSLSVEVIYDCDGPILATKPDNMLVGRINGGTPFEIDSALLTPTATGNLEIAMNGCVRGRGVVVLIDSPLTEAECESLLCQLGAIYREVMSGQPIQLRDGNKLLNSTDLSIRSATQTLTFERYYNQARQEDAGYQHMGLGWSHNHYHVLQLDGTGNAQIDTPDGGVLKFSGTGISGPFTPLSGNIAELNVVSISPTTDAVYELVTPDKTRYVFEGDVSGSAPYALLLTQREASDGTIWDYTYNAGLLTRVEDSDGRALVFTYHDSSVPFKAGQLASVAIENNSVGTGQSISLDYVEEKIDGVVVTSPRPLLSDVTDVRGETWTYDYFGQDSGETTTDQLNFLVRRYSPTVDQDGDLVDDAIIALQTLDYTTANGNISAIHEELGDGAIEKDFTFQPNGENVTTEAVVGTTPTIHRFAGDIYIGQDADEAIGAIRVLDDTYRPAAQSTANADITEMTWDSNGVTLEGVTDAEGNETDFSYDSQDRLTSSTDAEGRRTDYTYGSTDAPRQPTVIEVYDTNGTTLLQKQTITYDTQGRTIEEAIIDPADGTTVLQKTTRTYGTSGNSNGLLESVTVHDTQDASNNQTTSYTYDTAGRVIKTGRSSLYGSCQFTFTVYDDAGNVLVSACSQNDISGSITEAAIDAHKVSDPEGTNVTKHVYDAMGRRVRTISDAGGADEQTSLTVYDALSRVVMTVNRYVDDSYTAPATWSFDSPAGVWKDGNSTVISHGDGSENFISTTAYNARGLTRRTQDVFGVVTLYGYDEADRLVKTVVSASQPAYDNDYAAGDPDLSAYVTNSADDQDIVTEQVYDPAGNLVESIDARGLSTFTVYDALNRPVKVVRNAKQDATVAYDFHDPEYDVTNDPRADQYVISTDPDRDQITTTEYDALGRVIRTRRLLENRFSAGEEWDVSLTGYDSLGRVVKSIQHASQPTYDLATDPDLSAYVASSDPDTDMVTQTVYDAQGRAYKSIDVEGNVSLSGFDGLGRQVKAIRNASTPGYGIASDPDLSAYTLDLSDPAADLTSETFYDADGRVQRTAQLISVDGGQPVWVWTLIGYDSLGRQVRTIRNAANPNYFDSYADPDLSDYATNVGLSTDSDEDIVTETVYDTQGRAYKSIDSRGNVSLTGFDAAGRRVKTITNASDPSYDVSFDPDLSGYTGSNPAADQDRVSTTVYGLGGRVLETIDPAGNTTRFVYDQLGRRTLTMRNYVVQATSPDNWTWANNQWEDGSAGAIYHRLAFDQNLITETVYNKAGQVVSTRDARGTVTQFVYDDAGRRLQSIQAAGTAIETVSYTAFDKAGRVRRTIQNYVAGVDSPDSVTGDIWDFDPTSHGANNDENLISVFIYDAASRRVQTLDPMDHTQETVYDKRGQVVQQIDPTGVTTAFRYDAAGRRKTVVAAYDDTLQTTDPADWTWDAVSEQWQDS